MTPPPPKRPLDVICSHGQIPTVPLGEKAAAMIDNDMYVDDLTSGTNSTDEIEQRKKGIREILRERGFKINRLVTSFDDSPDTLALLGTGEIGRILGVIWDLKKDYYAL